MEIPAGEFSAYLFDCDGTIADSMPVHFQAWNEVLAPRGAHFSRELFRAWAGIPTERIVEMLNERFHWSLPVAEVAAAREARYLELLPGIAAVPFVLSAIERARGRIPMAVVSGSPRASVLRTLSFLGLERHFNLVVAGGDCPRGKPHPDPYLLAAKGLGVLPDKCLVFEDADLGVESAKAAGMQWVRVESGW